MTRFVFYLAGDAEIWLILKRRLKQPSIKLNEVEIYCSSSRWMVRIFHKSLYNVGSVLGIVDEEHNIHVRSRTGCIFTNQPSFLGPSCILAKPSFSSTSSFRLICSKRSASCVPSSSFVGIAGAALEFTPLPPLPRPLPLFEPPRQFPRKLPLREEVSPNSLPPRRDMFGLRELP